MIRVIYIKNLLEAPEKRGPIIYEQWRPGLHPRDVAPKEFDLEGCGLVSLNSRSLTGNEVEEIELQEGDELIFGSAPGIAEALGLTGLAAFLLNTAIMVGVSIGISYGLAAMNAPKKLSSATGTEEGPSRNFSGIQDTSGAGYVRPTIYGQLRTGGHFLQSFERPASGEQVQDGITTLHTLLGVCTGPIEDIEDIRINRNPVEIIPNVQTGTRLGTATQSHLDGFHEIVQETVHQRAIQHQDGWLTFITTREVEAVEITFRFPGGLLRGSPEGNPLAHDVGFDIRVYSYGGAEENIQATYSKNVSAKTRNPFKAQLRIDLEKLGLYRFDIKRITDDDDEQSGSLSYISASEVYAISDITYDTQAHPGLAMVGLRQVPSEQLNASVPTNYTFFVTGQNDIRVYSDVDNYTEEWSNNPAWCCAHYITSKETGLGDKYTWDHIDLADFLAWAAFCNELVPDGRGGQEKRCTFDFSFDKVYPADEAISIFQEGSGAMVIKRGSRWTVVLDEPADIVWTGNSGNMLPGSFTLTYSPTAQAANRLQATFYNAAEDYKRDTLFMELPDLDPGTPYIEANRDIRGVTRQSQIMRELTRLLLHNKLSTTQVELDSGLDVMALSAGAVFAVSSKVAGIGIASGRILAIDSSETQLTIDEEVVIEGGETYEIVVQHSTGDEISTKTIVNQPGTTDLIFSADANWSATLSVGDVYSLGKQNSAIERYRCMELSKAEEFRTHVRGVRYDANIYSYDLAAYPTHNPLSNIPDPRLVPANATDLTLAERLQAALDGTLETVIDVDWTAPISAILDHFEVWLRLSDSFNYELVGTTKIPHFTISAIESPGYTYWISVVSVSANNQKLPPSEGVKSYVITEANTTQPADPSNLQAYLIDGSLVATVETVDNLGPAGFYEWRSGSTWNQSVLLDRTKTPRLEIKSYNRGTVSILVKAVNEIGNSSATAASTSITLIGQVEENIILTQDEAPSWSGRKIGFTVDSGDLTMIGETTSVNIQPARRRTRRLPRSSGFGVPAQTPEAVPRAEYILDPITVSAGDLVKARADVQVDFDSIYIGLGTFAAATFAFDSPSAQVPFSGTEEDKIRIRTYSRVSITTDTESAYSAWLEHVNRAEIDMVYLQFKIIAEVESAAYAAKLNDVTVTIDLPDKVQMGSVTHAAATSKETTYPTDFFVAVKRLLVTLIGGTNGDYVKITAQDEVSFTTEIRDASHSLTTGTFHYEARGY